MEDNALEYVTLKNAWAMYKEYIDYALVKYPLSKTPFAAELNNYFEQPRHDEYVVDDTGKRVHLNSVYRDFKKDIFSKKKTDSRGRVIRSSHDIPEWLQLKSYQSDMLLNYMSDWKAQYAFVDDFGNERPKCSWDKCKSTLNSILPNNLHFILPKDNHYIFIDLDLKDENGQKSFKKVITSINE